MESSFKRKKDIAQELIDEMKSNYQEILHNKTINQLLDVLQYELHENERLNTLDMTIHEFLEDWASSGLF